MNLSSRIILSLTFGFFCWAGIASAQEEPIELTQDAAMAAAIQHHEPEYTPVAKQLKVEGTVEIAVYINARGEVFDTVVVVGNPILVQMCVDAVSKWKFTPFLNEAGKPGKAVVHLRFHLKVPGGAHKP
jgi:TonB family protein